MLEESYLREVEVNAADLVHAFENHDPDLFLTLDQDDGTISDDHLDEEADPSEWDFRYIEIPPFEWDFSYLVRQRFVRSLPEATAKQLPPELPASAGEDELRSFLHAFDESISRLEDHATMAEASRAWRAFQEDVAIRYAKHWLAEDYKVEAIIPPIHSAGGVYPYSSSRRQLELAGVRHRRSARLDSPSLSESGPDFSIQEIYVARYPFDSVWPLHEPDGQLSLNRRYERDERRDIFYFEPTNEPGRARFIKRYCRKMWLVSAPYAVLGDAPRSATLYYGNTDEESYPVYDDWQELLDHVSEAVDWALERGRIDKSSQREIRDRLEAENCSYTLSR